jgi:hypothetical protein
VNGLKLELRNTQHNPDSFIGTTGAGDLVIWDNRATMHRGQPFDDTSHRRELRRVTTLDIAPSRV